jgi:eukaryotic-like serine/threonine-protein kinase
MDEDDSVVQSLLEEALNSGRTAEEVCAAHPQHLVEVRRRLFRIRALAGELERAFPSSDGDSLREANARAELEELPRIPGYEFEAVIGHGGMGVVYRARHIRLDRVVAVKMLRSGDRASEKELAALVREAQAIAALRHAQIVQVHDVGELNGLPYFTMEYVEGGSLARRLEGKPLPAREAATLVAGLAAAVQAAHSSGIVHRDLKPANVLVGLDGIPKISDFGLARRTQGNPDHTLSAAAVGTPSYMAPEQALGNPEAFGPSVDVYSLGALLYELLTGRPPFRAESNAETQRQVVSQDPVPPSRLNARVPRDLETICLKCLQKSPARRYATAQELADDLGRFLRSEPIRARPVGKVERAAKWMRRHPATTTAFGFGMLLAVAAIIGLAWYIATAEASRRAIEGDLDEVERMQRDSNWTAANSALQRASLRLGERGPNDLRVRLDTAKRNKDAVSRLEEIRMIRAGGFRPRQGPLSLRSDLDYTALYQSVGVGAGPPDEAAARIRDSNISKALTDGMYEWFVCTHDQDRMTWILSVLNIVDSDQGGWRDRSRDRAVWRDEEAVNRLIADARVDGQSTDYLLWFAELIKQLGHDQTPFLRKVQAAHSNDFWVNHVLGRALRHQKHELEAVRFLQAAIALRPEMAVSHNDLGNCLRNLYRFDEAIQQLQEAVRLEPAVPMFHGNLGLTLGAVGRHVEAAEQFELGLREDPDDAQMRLNLGQALAELGRDREAIEQYKDVAARAPGYVLVVEPLIAASIREKRTPEAIAVLRSWIEEDQSKYVRWDGLAELCLFAGATQEYENTRADLLRLFGSSRNAIVCEKVGLACLLSPPTEAQQAAAAALIDRALTNEKGRRTQRYPYVKLAKALAEYRAGHLEDALDLIDPEVRSVPGPMPQLVRALALSEVHRDTEALAELAQAATTFDWRPCAADSRDARMYHILRREAESKILPNLDAFTRGTYWPTGADERLALIATSEDNDMHLAAARLFAEVFEADPALARNIENQCRYRAACAAAMCGCGRSTGGTPLTPEEQARWRERSLQWLRADFAAHNEGGAKADEIELMARWRSDPDLRAVRDPPFLATLPEKAAFGAFWADVDGALGSHAAK